MVCVIVSFYSIGRYWFLEIELSVQTVFSKGCNHVPFMAFVIFFLVVKRV